ncbi:MAG: hypothetical protein US36_C0001G0009 [Candidatus Wolfebacteria bacterium GW2011_GWC1_37_10]|uniref:Bacterial type II secretion system protein E domain-containing protein n=1 Tax=Candidatus Wolfebacteria bacterium GW2011_GWC1_37_10 TaxID=1619010 RepID=A0A0G0GBF6_9BACT|nr:MAG: hypothetical protein US36_C0001G0009 [Candidatus Wolfebacteria bacterium GW2011_GWC1_37_10]
MKPIAEIKNKLKQMKREAEERDAKRAAEKSKLSYLNVFTTPINTEALAIIAEERAKKIKAAAVELKENKLAVAVYDPGSKEIKKLKEELEVKGYQVTIFVVSLPGLNYIFDFYKFVSKEPGKISGKISVGQINDLKKNINSLDGLNQALGLMNLATVDAAMILELILLGAMANRASDIHFEPIDKKIKIRLRIDGILHDVFENQEKSFYFRLLSKIKLLSNLKINIYDEPQDGRFTINLENKEVEVRVAIAPSEFGEVVVMRLLDPEAINISLGELGIREDDLEIIKTELKRPNGLILNTGPTGSGKTTTLYAFLKHKKTPKIKIITIEDPIEYHLEGIEQTQVDEEAGYNFSDGLKSLMRQDPDVILVGEIRDKETGEIGIQAALTGHLVFSTIHANSAAGAIPRLVDLGVKSSSIGSALNLIIAQRLVRKLCDNCKTIKETDNELKIKIEKFLKQLPKRVNKEKFKEIKIFSASKGGCDKCNNSGYKGRIGIYELILNDPEYEKLLIDPNHIALSSHKELDELIFSSAPESAIKKFALEQGMATMQQDGILKIISGMTTFEEVEEVTGRMQF